MNKKEAIKKIGLRIKKVAGQKGFDKKGIPFFKCGNETGILFIPGFDNTSHIMQEYADYFSDKGFTVYNITLPGRGVTVEEFGSTKWEEWVEFAMEDYLLLKSLVKKIFLAGFSTGATIVLLLAEKLKGNDLPDGLILTSPALFFVSRLIPLSVQAALFNIYAKINPFPKKLDNRHKIFVDPKALKKYDYLERSSSYAVLELFKLAKIVKKDIDKITTPALIIQSRNDAVIEKYGAVWLFKNIKSFYKKILWLKKSGHPVIVDVEKDKVFSESHKFIERLQSGKLC